jgi:hypothetical protein
VARFPAIGVLSDEGWPPAPEGFRRRSEGRRTLYAAEVDAADASARGLLDRSSWERVLAGGDRATGRGASATLARGGGAGWRLKQLKRGGWAARVLGDRYASPLRLIRILAASGEVARRGVPTPRAVALLVERAGAGFVRGFLATEELAGAEDLARRADRRDASEDDLRAALEAVRRMHDRGVDHPDLNLGNLLVVDTPEGPRGYVIDLDGVTFGDGPVSLPRRRRALRRLERSCAKRTGSAGYLGPGSEDLWYALYAGGDAELARALSRGRSLRRLSIAIHRLGWRGGVR